MGDKITISNLSRHLGLSESTVSKALNGRKDVSALVRERVMRTAQELGYTPNPQARKLALRDSGTIGIFLLNRFDRPVNSYFGYQFLSGILKEAQDREKDVLIFSECPQLQGRGYLEYCRMKGAEGAIFIGLWHEDPQMDQLAHSSFPTVSLDTPIPGHPRGFITSDNRAGMTLLTRHVMESGRWPLGFIGIRGNGFVGKTRREAFLAAVEEDGKTPAATVLEAPLSLEGGRNAALELLASPLRPQALVCASDLQAFGALEAARELGLRVPEDLAITGFDDLQAASFTHPPLTTYAQDTQAMGRLAVEHLFDPPTTPGPHLVPGRLILRSST